MAHPLATQSTAPFRGFAVIPAAGRSRRMGRPKLLLPWKGRTVIETVLAAWREGGVSRVIVVTHPEDQDLAEVCRAAGAETVVAATAPAEMKDSVLLGLKHIEEHFHPQPQDVWLTAPADLPNLNPRIIARLLASHVPEEPRIIVPRIGERRGHPVLFAWPLAAEVRALRETEGLNVLFQKNAVRELALSPAEAGEQERDLDTPEDYDRLLREESPKER